NADLARYPETGRNRIRRQLYLYIARHNAAQSEAGGEPRSGSRQSAEPIRVSHTGAKNEPSSRKFLPATNRRRDRQCFGQPGDSLGGLSRLPRDCRKKWQASMGLSEESRRQVVSPPPLCESAFARNHV